MICYEPRKIERFGDITVVTLPEQQKSRHISFYVYAKKKVVYITYDCKASFGIKALQYMLKKFPDYNYIKDVWQKGDDYDWLLSKNKLTKKQAEKILDELLGKFEVAYNEKWE